jgi:hypothetical protein
MTNDGPRVLQTSKANYDAWTAHLRDCKIVGCEFCPTLRALGLEPAK